MCFLTLPDLIFFLLEPTCLIFPHQISTHWFVQFYCFCERLSDLSSAVFYLLWHTTNDFAFYGHNIEYLPWLNDMPASFCLKIHLATHRILSISIS